jgi:hypothetical protein
MKVTIVLDGSEISSSTLKHFFTKIYCPENHDLSLLYALPSFTISKTTGRNITNYPPVSFADLNCSAIDFLSKTEKQIRDEYQPNQTVIETSFCSFGLSKNEQVSIEKREVKLDQVVGKNLVASVVSRFSENTPDAVVFACRGYLRLKNVMNELSVFYRSAQLIKHRCSVDLTGQDSGSTGIKTDRRTSITIFADSRRR